MAGDNRSASQRIGDLERVASGLYGAADQFARDIDLLKNIVKQLGNRVEALSRVAALHAPGLTDLNELVRQEMININSEEMKARLDALIAQGVLKLGETTTNDSFLVSQEVDKDGKVANPRLQFAVSALGNKEHVAKLVGSKAGDLIVLEEDKLRIKVLEVYDIVPPEQIQDEASPASPEEAAPAQAPTGNA